MPFAEQPTAEQPTAQQPTAEVPPAWVPPAPDAPPLSDPPPPPPPTATAAGFAGPGATGPGATGPTGATGPGDPTGLGAPPPPPGAGGAGGEVPPAAPPPWFGGGGPGFSREKLVRPTRGRYIGGVCAAIGRATNTDPVLWRVLLVVLGLFGGVGVLIYLIGWIGIQGEGDSASPIESLLGRGRSGMAPFSVVLLGAATVLTFAFIVRDGFRATLLGGAVLLGVALLIKRNTGAGAGGPVQDAAFPFGSAPVGATAPTGGASGPAAAFAAAGAPAAAQASGSPAPTAAPAGEPLTTPLAPRPPGYQPHPPTEPFTQPQFSQPQFTQPPATDYRPPFAPHGPYASLSPSAPAPRAPKPPKPPRERSKLGRITFFAVLMVLGVLALADVAALSVPVSAYFAAALATIGLGLIVGAWFGRARGLIALAIIASLGLSISSLSERYGAQVANSDYRPTTLAQVADRYDFKLGNVMIDLRAVDFSRAQQDVTVTMNVGQVKVLLPEKVDTTAAVAMEGGRAVVFGHEYDGNNVRAINLTDPGTDGTGGGTLRLTIQVKTGNVEVAR